MSFASTCKQKFEQQLSYFPALIIGLTAFAFFRLIENPTLPRFLIIPGILYGIPLFTFRVINLFSPLKEGASYIGESGYSPWLGSHKIQMIYHSFPVLERVLILVPGLFSLWLRLWGSKIGKSVYWTPHTEVVDRTHLEIGDHVFIGNKVYLSPHVVTRKRGRFFLYFKRVRIGDGAFIGAGSRFGPGATVEAGAHVPLLSDFYVNRTVKEGATHE